jgi:hypothetical protein
MMPDCRELPIYRWAICWMVLLLAMADSAAAAGTPEEWLRRLNDYPHARLVERSEQEVIDHEIGLGAMQKVRGTWRFKESERLSGRLLRYTWQIVDGFSSYEIMEDLVATVEAQEGSELVFQCKGRACGSAVQWANRVFGQRVLYGREGEQRYRVYALQGERRYRLAIYSAARTADRQYLHVDLLRVEEGEAAAAEASGTGG